MSEPILSEDAKLLAAKRGIGDLAQKMGIEILELSAERAVATMPVSGNTQPRGLLHGGAYLVLGETLGSFAANVALAAAACSVVAPTIGGKGAAAGRAFMIAAAPKSSPPPTGTLRLSLGVGADGAAEV